MNFQLVVVEREENTENKILASSGLLVDDKFVIVTSNIFSSELHIITNLKGNNYENIKLNPFDNKSILLKVVRKKNDGIYEVKTGKVFAVYHSTTITKSDIFLKNFAIDSIDSNRNVAKLISTFFILTLDSRWTLHDFKKSLQTWWHLVGRINIQKCDKVCIESSPFGNRFFLNSLSQGIVSNILGKDSCLIFSDCPSTPGSEGSPVFIGSHK